MANRERGEVGLTVGAQTYRLKLTINAMCEIEDALSTPDQRVSFTAFLERLSENSVRDMRLVLWGALREYHPEVTLEGAGTLIQQLGGLVEFTQQLVKLTAATEPDAADLQALGVDPSKARPRKARQSGTGGQRTSRPAALISTASASGG